MPHPKKLTADWVESWEKLLAQNLPFKVFLKGPDLTYLACNEKYAIDHGLKSSEILGRSDFDLYPRELAETYRAEDLRILETGRSETIEGRYLKDGQEHHGQTIKSLFRDQSDEVIGILGTFWDISELRRAEEALQESEERYAQINNSTLDYIVSYDSTGRITNANRAFCEAMGLSLDQVIGKTHADLGFPEDKCLEWAETIREAFETDEPVTTFTSTTQKDGSVRYFEVSLNSIHNFHGDRIGVNLISRNITDRKRVEEALRESERKLKIIVDLLPVGVSVLDNERKIVYENPALRKIIQMDREGLRREKYKTRTYTRPDGTPMSADEFASIRAAREQKAIHNVETGIVLEDGKLIWTEVSAVPVALPDWKMVIFTVDTTERRQAEEALKESEHRLADIIDFLPDATFAINLKGEVIAWNRSLEELTGAPKEELIGKGNFAYAVPFYGKTGPMLIDRIFQDWKEMEKNYDYLTKREDQLIAEAFVPALRGGKGAYLWGIASPLYDSSGAIVGAIESLRDISERKWIEEELRESHERFRLANRATFNAIWDWNLQTDTLWRNENFQVLFGYPAEEIEPSIESWANRIHPEDVDRIKVSIHAAIDSGQQSWFDQYRFRRKDGIYAEVEDRGYISREVDGKPVRMIGAMQDITDRKRSEEALQESEEKHRAVVERANDGIVIMQDGTIRFSNPSLLAMTGYETGEIEGMEFSRFIPQENRAGVEERYRKRMAGEELSSVFETALLHKSGKKIPVEMNGVVILYEGKPADLVIMRDITERKRLEGELDKARADFLFGVSHELKTPLFLMNISLEILENSTESGRAKRTEEFLETWRRNLHRLQHLVFNMVDSQRTQTMGFKLERQPTDSRALIERVVQEEELLAKPKKVRITLDLAPIPPLFVDPDAIHRLVENLLTNAIKFSPRSGEVTIRLREEDAQAVLTVKDQGHGISAEEQEGLFLPFQRAATAVHNVIPGTGLGLYVAKIIVDAHGGTISLQSKVGKGTTITVRLPLGVPQDKKQLGT